MTKLKPKDKAFAKEYVLNGNNAKEAVAKVEGITNGNYAKQKGHRQMKKPEIQAEIQKIAQSIADRIPDDLLIKRHKELLNKREYQTFEGESEDVGPDSQAVSKGLDMAYKLKGSYAAEKSLNVNVSINAENRDKIISLAKEVSNKLMEDEIKNS